MWGTAEVGEEKHGRKEEKGMETLVLREAFLLFTKSSPTLPPRPTGFFLPDSFPLGELTLPT